MQPTLRKLVATVVVCLILPAELLQRRYTSFHYDLTSRLLWDGKQNVLALRVSSMGSNSRYVCVCVCVCVSVCARVRACCIRWLCGCTCLLMYVLLCVYNYLRWYAGAGLYRHVWLDVTPKIHVAPMGLAIVPVQADIDLTQRTAVLVINATFQVDKGSAAAAADTGTQPVEWSIDIRSPDGSTVCSVQTTVVIPPPPPPLPPKHLRQQSHLHLPTRPLNCSIVSPRVNCKGDDLARQTGIASAGVCCGLCHNASNNGCRAWTFSAHGGICEFKTNCSNPKGGGGGQTSGGEGVPPQPSPPSPPSPHPPPPPTPPTPPPSPPTPPVPPPPPPPAVQTVVVVQNCTISNILPWSTETPHLYTALATLKSRGGTDSVNVTFGIRKISFSADKGFQLNGVPTKLRGGCVHHANGPLGAKAIDRAEERRVELLKGLGYNAIRTSHNPVSPAFVAACDRLGVLLMEEAFDCWEQGKTKDDYHVYFDEWWERDVRSMVLRDRNAPSIVMWSIGNEIPMRRTQAGWNLSAKLTSFIHDLDPLSGHGRAVTSAYPNVDNNADSYFKPLDVAGYNYGFKRYGSDHLRVPARVMVGTESLPKSSYDNWAAVWNYKHVIGDFIWTAMDCGVFFWCLCLRAFVRAWACRCRWLVCWGCSFPCSAWGALLTPCSLCCLDGWRLQILAKLRLARTDTTGRPSKRATATAPRVGPTTFQIVVI